MSDDARKEARRFSVGSGWAGLLSGWDGDHMIRLLVPLVLVTALVCAFGQQATQDLSRYAGRDLRKLATNEVAALQAEFRVKAQVVLGEKWGSRPLAPWLVDHYETAGVSWVLAEVYPGYEIPDVSGMKLHFFERSWDRCAVIPFRQAIAFF